MTTLPRISIIMPLANNEAHVAEAVESVLAQTMQDFELLVVDADSTDRSLQIVERFTDLRIRCIVRPEGTPGAILNTGIRLARAPVVTFLDPRDVLAPHALARGLALLAGQDNLGVVLPRVAYLDGLGGVLRQSHLNRARPLRGGEILMGRGPGGVSGLMLRRRALQDVARRVRRERFSQTEFFNEALPALEAQDLCTRIAALTVWTFHRAEGPGRQPLLGFRLLPGRFPATPAAAAAEWHAFAAAIAPVRGAFDKGTLRQAEALHRLRIARRLAIAGHGPDALRMLSSAASIAPARTLANPVTPVLTLATAARRMIASRLRAAPPPAWQAQAA